MIRISPVSARLHMPFARRGRAIEREHAGPLERSVLACFDRDFDVRVVSEIHSLGSMLVRVARQPECTHKLILEPGRRNALFGLIVCNRPNERVPLGCVCAACTTEKVCDAVAVLYLTLRRLCSRPADPRSLFSGTERWRVAVREAISIVISACVCITAVCCNHRRLALVCVLCES